MVGILREEESLSQAPAAITDLRDQLPHQCVQGQDPCFNREWVEGLQNENMLDVLEAVVRASLARRESRGALYRVDYPFTDDDRWLCNLVLQRHDAGWTIREESVQELVVSLPQGKRAYGRKGGEDRVPR